MSIKVLLQVNIRSYWPHDLEQNNEHCCKSTIYIYIGIHDSLHIYLPTKFMDVIRETQVRNVF